MNAFGSAHYVITLDLDEIDSMKLFNNIGKKTGGYLGKVRSNAQGTEYNLFGPGENPNKGLSADKTRDQFAGVFYVSQYLQIGAYAWQNERTPQNQCAHTRNK